MNTLDRTTQAQIVTAMVEGASIRSISRMTGSAKGTVISLLERMGEACQAHHDRAVTSLPAKCARFQCDEIHAFCYARKQHLPPRLQGMEGFGDVWTWTALCDTTRLIASWHVGGRTASDAASLIHSLITRCPHRIMITTDGNVPYLTGSIVAPSGSIDMAMLQKIYRNEPKADPLRRYAPSACIGVKVLRTRGNPDLSKASTSLVERSNLSIRMGMRRFTRLTNAHSKKLANHKHALALYFTYYNWVRIHQSLRVTPAMAAGLTNRLWSVADIVDLLPDHAAQPHATLVPAAATL